MCYHFLSTELLVLGGVMFIVLVIGPKISWFNQAERAGILTAIRIFSTTSFSGEVKSLRNVKHPLRNDKILIGKIQRPFLAQILPASLHFVFIGFV
jgi:hypothetical protein